MKQRRWPWLLVFVSALLGAAYLLNIEVMPTAHEPKSVDFPTRMGPDDKRRAVARRVLPARKQTPPKTDAKGPPSPLRPRDPLLAAFPPGKSELAIVGELSALRNSPLGEMILSCLGKRGWNELNKFEKESGLNPLEDLDRIGAFDGGLFLTGNFKNFNRDALHAKSGTPWGDKGQIYTKTRESLGIWDNQLVILADSEADIKDAIDRIEGRLPAGQPPIPESQTYGDVYGVMSAASLAKLLKREQGGLSQKVLDTAKQLDFHVDASGDLALSAKLVGEDEAAMDELARALAGLISAGRLGAAAKGEDSLAELLDFAKVTPRGKDFSMELLLPESFLEEHIGSCEWLGGKADQTEAANTPAAKPPSAAADGR